MVNVEVDDQDALQMEAASENFSSNSNVVEETKAHCLLVLGMVAFVCLFVHGFV